MTQPLDVVWPEPDGAATDYMPISNGNLFDPYNGHDPSYMYTSQEVDYRGNSPVAGAPAFPDIDAGIRPDPAIGQSARPSSESPYSVGPVGNGDGTNSDVDRPAYHVYWPHDLEGWVGPVGQADGRADILSTVAYGIASSSATVPTDDEVTAMLLTQAATEYATL